MLFIIVGCFNIDIYDPVVALTAEKISFSPSVHDDILEAIKSPNRRLQQNRISSFK